jgi:hypothetical protein
MVVTSEAAMLAADKGLEAVSDLPDTAVCIALDEASFRRMMLILLDNALGSAVDRDKYLRGLEPGTPFSVLRTRGDHGEAIVLYLGGFLAIALLGPGRFSLDHKLQIGRLFRRRFHRP